MSTQPASPLESSAARWAACVRWAVGLRRELHRMPELAWAEEATAARIRAELDGLGIAWRACAGTGTVADLAVDAPGPMTALRADIDGLPIIEDTGAEWASLAPGRMHACGHDGHTAVLLAAARWLKENEERLPAPVRLVFQPAEEGGHGAKRMLEDGALEGAAAIYGWHNWPAIPFGRAVCPDGPVMAANGTFRIVVVGEGGHSSQPELCRDPVLAAAAITMELQQVVSRRVPPQEPAVVSVTSIDAPSSETVIPGRAELSGSIRIADTAMRDRVGAMIAEVAGGIAAAHGVSAEIELLPRYGATRNHPGEAARMRAALARTLGPDWRDERFPVPAMASEDFSYYLAAIPGAFALVGAEDGAAHGIACHNARYDFNDALVAPAARLLADLAGAPPPS